MWLRNSVVTDNSHGKNLHADWFIYGQIYKGSNLLLLKDTLRNSVVSEQSADKKGAADWLRDLSFYPTSIRPLI